MAVHLVLILVQVLFSSLAITGKFVLGEVPAPALVLARVLGAAVVLAGVHRLTRSPEVRERGDLLRLLWLGALGIVANQTLFLLGLSRTTAINASVLVATTPVFTVLNSILFREERASALKIGGVCVAALGAVWMVGPGRVTLGSSTALGNLMILGGMYAYSHYLVLGKRMVRRYGPVTVTAYVMAFAAFGIIPMGVPAAAGTEWHQVHATTWLWVAYIVAGPTIATYFLNVWALRRASSNLVAAYIYLQPVLTAVVAPLVLRGEGVTRTTLIGAAGIFGGLALVIAGEAVKRGAVESLPLSSE